MKVLALLALLALPAIAQTPPSCVCVNGCTFVGPSFTPGTGQPTQCNTYVNGHWASWDFMTDTAKVNGDNTAICMPASVAYDPLPLGSKACVAKIPPQPVGPVTITFATGNPTFDAALVPYTFNNVATIAPPASAASMQRIVK